MTVSGGILDLGGTTQTQNGGVRLTNGAIQNGALSSSGTFGLQSGMVSATLAGSGGLSKTTVGTAILTGTSTYTGGTTIAAGTLQLGNGGTSGLISGNAINDGILAFDRSDIVTVTGFISGTGAVTQIGTGTTTFLSAPPRHIRESTTVTAGTLGVTGSGTFGASSGAVTVSGGVLDLGGTTQTQNGGVTLTNGTIQNGTLSSSGTFGLQAWNGQREPRGGAAGLSKWTAGTVTLSGANTYSGGTTISSGTLGVRGHGHFGRHVQRRDRVRGRPGPGNNDTDPKWRRHADKRHDPERYAVIERNLWIASRNGQREPRGSSRPEQVDSRNCDAFWREHLLGRHDDLVWALGRNGHGHFGRRCPTP